MSDFFCYLKNHLLKSLACLALSLATYVAAIIPPILIGRFIDDSLETSTFSVFFALLIFCVAVSTLVLGAMLAYILSRLVVNFIDTKYLDTINQLLQKERLLFTQVKSGEILDLFSRYISIYEDITASLIATFIPSIIGIAVIIAAITSISSLLFGLAVLAIEIVVFIITLILMHFYSLRLRKYAKSAYALSDQWVEIIANNRIVQNEGSFTNAIKGLSPFVHAMTKNLQKKNFFSDFNSDFRAFARIIAIVSSVFILLQYYAGSSISVGNILTIITLVSFLGVNFDFIISHLVLSKNYKVYKDDFESLIRYKNFIISGKSLCKSFNTVTISNYVVIKDDREILSLTTPLTFKGDEKICVLGLSGAGKTTLVSLFEDANLEYSKVISINGIYRENINTTEYKNLVRISFQENTIMSGKGYGNWFQRENLEPATVRRILKKLYLPEDIENGERCLHSYETNISGGEAKRLNVARLLVRPGAINIFDEPTNGLNPSLARKVWQTIFEELTDKLIICTTHDLDQLEKFDRIIVIDDGKIVTDTTPEKLLHSKSFIRIKDEI